MIFDGPNTRIILEASDTDIVEMAEIYSRWKDWVLSGVGAPYALAFEAIGGQPLGGGRFAGSYYFLQTAAGWLIRPREANHVLTLLGNLYPAVAGEPVLAATIGGFQVQIRLETSSLTQIATGGDPASIAAAVWAAEPTTEGVVVTDGGNSATVFKTDLTESATDHWKDALVRIASGALLGQVKKVTAYNGTTKVLTVSGGFTGTPADGVSFVLINR